MKRKLLLWLMQTKIYKFFLKKVFPYIRFTTYYTKMKGYVYHIGYTKLKPGHIILTVDKSKLTSLLIPGDFSHAGFCISKDGKWETSEMTHEDYTKSTFADMCFQSDRVVILECINFDEEYIQKVIKRCRGFSQAKYDTHFSLGVKELYCSELIYQSDYEKRLDVNLDDLAGIGRPYISPTGLYKAKNVCVIFDSDDFLG